ncbi:MAG: DUF4139 domain-containing protein [Planctomycetota bacterium]|jgi:hypothetical protein
MRGKLTTILIAVLLLFITGQVQAEQTAGNVSPAQSRVTSVSLFKNGLAVVRREVTLSMNGLHEIAGVPEPVHGTFWIESDAVLETRVTTREYEVPMRMAASPNLQDDLAGRAVVIHFRDADRPPVTGRVVEMTADADEATWNRSYAATSPAWNHWRTRRQPPLGSSPNAYHRFLVLDSGQGHDYIDTSVIASIHVDRPATTVRERRPVLLVNARGIGARPATVAISYLTKGMAWAPSYRIDMTNSTTLTVAQQAIIKNELEDLDDVEIELISGFPSIEFANVLSPLSLETTLTGFFSQLSQMGHRSQLPGGSAVSRQMVMYNAPSPGGGLDPSIVPTGDGVDVHYQSIGRRTLREGDSLMLGVASGQTRYERIVEWTVPDTRDAYGRPVADWSHQPMPENEIEDVWDAVRFRNPLSYPMTTAPAMIVADGRFNGQRTSQWVNPGEQTTLQITPALSVRTRAAEYEETGEHEVIEIGGRRFRRTIARGDLLVGNHRNESITIVIRRRFSGELIEADGDPEQSLSEEGVYSINQRNELTWTITLEPGSERTLEYRYKVLVHH